MKKNILLGLLAALVLTFAGCDLNLFNNFEDIPSFTPQEMNESISEIESNEEGEEGLIDDTKVVEANSEPNKPPKVNSGAVTYIDNVTAMVENDTIDDFGDDADKEKIAKNLDIVVTSVLKDVGIDLSDDDEDTSNDSKTFEDFVKDKYSAATDEEVQELRDVVQKSASASVDIRLAADPEAKSLISNTMLMLLDMLNNEDDSSRSARELVHDGQPYENLSGHIQLRLGVTDDPGYILFAENTTDPETSENVVEIGFEVFDDTENYDKKFNDTSTERGYIVPWEELLDGGDEDLEEFLSLINDSLADGSFGVPSLESRLGLIESLLSDDENTTESDGMSMPELFDTVNEYIDLGKIKSLTNTFNGIAGSARAFASTLEFTSVDNDEIDISKVSAQFKGSTGGSLNGKGTDMATMSILSILFDFLFDTKTAEDTRGGMLNVDAFDKFVNRDDMVSSEIMNEDTDDEYMAVTIDYVAELIPSEYTFDTDTETAVNLRDRFFENLDFDLLTEHMFKWAGMAEDDGSDLVLTSKMKRDAARIEKLATLLNMRHFYVDEGAGIDNFTALLEDMIQDDEGE